MASKNLGERCEIRFRPVTDLKAEIAWFERLGCKLTARGAGEDAWARISDGTVHYGLWTGQGPSRSIVYFASDPGAVRALLQANRIAPKGSDKTFSFPDPDGTPVQIEPLEHGADPSQGAGTTLLGKFGECSWPVANVHASVAFWKKLGFDKRGGNWEEADPKPYPYAILTDKFLTIGLHQATDGRKGLWIHYFNGTSQENRKRLGRIRDAGIEIQTGKPGVKDPAAGWITSPSGQKFNLDPWE
ncbi:MAG: hypothetical protein FD180_4321 [Planctomycetota bacterium]|nr:MAG: hypothetical protein FD180_4321 [Planctomycetota bacterium]